MAKSRESGLSSGGGGATNGGGQGQETYSNGFSGPVNGRDITDSWESPDMAGPETDIEDVMDAQGFRGKPKVVGQEEYDRAVKEAWGGQGLEVVRGIHASNQETLDAYKDALTDGEWYVQCGGGAALGYGLYGAYTKGGKADERAMRVAEGYSVNHNEPAHIHRYTLDPSARIVNREDLLEEMAAYNNSVAERMAPKRRAAVEPVLEKYKGGTRAQRAAVKDYEAKSNNSNTQTFPRLAAMEHPRFDRTQKREYRDVANEIRRAYTSAGSPTIYKDAGIFGTARGYDFIYNEPNGYCVTLNRTKMIILDE